VIVLSAGDVDPGELAELTNVTGFTVLESFLSGGEIQRLGLSRCGSRGDPSRVFFIP
jgi:hypothetical protein